MTEADVRIKKQQQNSRFATKLILACLRPAVLTLLLESDLVTLSLSEGT